MVQYQFGPYAATPLECNLFESKLPLPEFLASFLPSQAPVLRQVVWVKKPLLLQQGRVLGYCLQPDAVRLIVRTPHSDILQWIKAEKLVTAAQASRWLQQQTQ